MNQEFLSRVVHDINSIANAAPLIKDHYEWPGVLYNNICRALDRISKETETIFSQKYECNWKFNHDLTYILHMTKWNLCLEISEINATVWGTDYSSPVIGIFRIVIDNIETNDKQQQFLAAVDKVINQDYRESTRDIIRFESIHIISALSASLCHRYIDTLLESIECIINKVHADQMPIISAQKKEHLSLLQYDFKDIYETRQLLVKDTYTNHPIEWLPWTSKKFYFLEPNITFLTNLQNIIMSFIIQPNHITIKQS